MKNSKDGQVIIKFSVMWFFIAIIIIALMISFFKNRIFATDVNNKETKTETVVAFEQNQKSIDVIQVMLANTDSNKKND